MKIRDELKVNKCWCLIKTLSSSQTCQASSVSFLAGGEDLLMDSSETASLDGVRSLTGNRFISSDDIRRISDVSDSHRGGEPLDAAAPAAGSGGLMASGELHGGRKFIIRRPHVAKFRFI